jgi:hypothetical protein
MIIWINDIDDNIGVNTKNHLSYTLLYTPKCITRPSEKL